MSDRMNDSGFTVIAKAPSNIALIKYMGKKDTTDNLPENASISMTLDSLCSVAEVTYTPGARNGVSWLAELPKSAGKSGLKLQVPMLGEQGIQRVHRHAERVRNAAGDILPHYGIAVYEDLLTKGTHTLRTANTFPPSSGIASSASSFAAITLATAMACAKDVKAFEKAWSKETGLRRALARVSRKGSGSSCRSFEGPWVLWEGDAAAGLETGMPKMSHFLIMVSAEPKVISSSDAHLMVRTSPLWSGRVDRVGERVRNLLSALGESDLKNIARIAWAEAWEMHSLFHTCAEPFTYWQAGTVEALQWLAPFVKGANPPIVTLDAGPNVHVLVESSQAAEWKKKLTAKFGAQVISEDTQGKGAEILS